MARSVASHWNSAPDEDAGAGTESIGRISWPQDPWQGAVALVDGKIPTLCAPYPTDHVGTSNAGKAFGEVTALRHGAPLTDLEEKGLPTWGPYTQGEGQPGELVKKTDQRNLCLADHVRLRTRKRRSPRGSQPWCPSG